DSQGEDVADILIGGLGEEGVLRDAESDVAHVVDGGGLKTAEVARLRQSDVDQLIEEVMHALAAERNLVADDVALAELEGRDRLLGRTRGRLLAGDAAKALEDSLLAGLVVDLADADRNHHLLQAWRLHDVRVAER